MRGNGVDIILDICDLKPGHDKYAFMKQCVTGDNIDRFLIICDMSYAEKANSRNGGASNETMIISPEVYAKAKQEFMHGKFLDDFRALKENRNFPKDNRRKQ